MFSRTAWLKALVGANNGIIEIGLGTRGGLHEYNHTSLVRAGASHRAVHHPNLRLIAALRDVLEPH